MWRRILAYILFAFGFLIITFFRKYSGTVIPYPSLFYLLGFIIFLGGLLFLRYTPTTKETNLQKQMAETINDLKENGERIKVDLTQCEIKENNYTEEQEKYGYSNELLTFDFERQIQAWNAIGGGSRRNIKEVRVEQSTIVYYHQNNRTGQTEKFVSRIIPKNKITLSFYLDSQKQTILYVDNTNRNKYYFDLDFLNN